jgi:AmmeMemoRadiSam system protein A
MSKKKEKIQLHFYKEEKMQEFNLSNASKKFLLTIARISIETKNKFEKNEIPEELNFKSGCFVTIHKYGNLRGCIGNFREIFIVENVYYMAQEAAYNDPRFPPLESNEFKEIDVEISVLSPMKKINDLNDIKVGRDGLYIRKGFNTGVLLPQVAVEYNWDKITFLSHTCMKAGLNQNCWKEEDTEIFKFEALIFSENDF